MCPKSRLPYIINFRRVITSLYNGQFALQLYLKLYLETRYVLSLHCPAKVPDDHSHVARSNFSVSISKKFLQSIMNEDILGLHKEDKLIVLCYSALTMFYSSAVCVSMRANLLFHAIHQPWRSTVMAFSVFMFIIMLL